MFMYPWGDFHSLNLGWFLVQFKAWTEKIQDYLDNGGGTSENLANVIAPVFNAENSYLTGDYVLYNNELYKAIEAVPAGTWNPDAWERCIVTEEMGSSASGIDNVARLMIAGQYSNTYNYQKYAICRYNDRLWMCNTNLPAGGEEWVPSHWDEITVGAGLTGLRRSADTLTQAISDETTARENAVSELQEQITANIETSTTASRTYNIGDYIVINGELYRVKTAIASGAALTPNTNIVKTDVGSELTDSIGISATVTANSEYCEVTQQSCKYFPLSGFKILQLQIHTIAEIPNTRPTIITLPPELAPTGVAVTTFTDTNAAVDYHAIARIYSGNRIIQAIEAIPTGLYLSMSAIYF